MQIRDRAGLETFRASRRFHNSLQPEQLAWAGRRGRVNQVGLYHGGDPLYSLHDLAGVWHESCLKAIATEPTVGR